MRCSSLLLATLPGWVEAYSYSVPLPRSSQPAAAPKSSAFPTEKKGPSPSSPSTLRSSSHARRCRPLFKKGFTSGGMSKQGDLMELMAKAKQDRLKKELEDKLRKSGDLPPEKDAATGATKEKRLPSGARRGSIKPDRSWRDAGDSPKAEASSAPSSSSSIPSKMLKAPAAKKLAGQKKRITGSIPQESGATEAEVEVWEGYARPGVRENEETRPASMYSEYEQLLDRTGDSSKGMSQTPSMENPRAAYQEYNELRAKKEWEAMVAGKESVANRSPIASETDYTDFEAMLSGGVPTSADSLGHAVAEKKLAKRAEKKLIPALEDGDFAPLDVWRVLADTEGTKVSFGLFQGTKPLLVIADPTPKSGEMRQVMQDLETRMPRKLVDTLAITADPPGTNRKISKKNRVSFPVLSDEGGEWMSAYRITTGGQREKMVFLIEPELGRILNSWSGFEALSVVDLVRDFLEPDQ